MRNAGYDVDWSGVDWSKVDEAKVVEIVRQGELFMQNSEASYSQGRQRAFDFLRTFVTLAIILIGVGFTPDFAEALRAAYFGAAASLTVSTLVIAPVLFPGGFSVPGCEPRYWIDDIRTDKPLTVMLGEQAQSLDEQQAYNDRVLRRMALQMKTALWIAAASPIAAICTGLGASWST